MGRKFHRRSFVGWQVDPRQDHAIQLAFRKISCDEGLGLKQVELQSVNCFYKESPTSMSMLMRGAQATELLSNAFDQDVALSVWEQTLQEVARGEAEDRLQKFLSVENSESDTVRRSDA